MPYGIRSSVLVHARQRPQLQALSGTLIWASHYWTGVADDSQGSCAFRMKAALALLLAALLATEPARALVCFSCSHQTSNWFCLKPTVCSSEDNYCVTSTASLGMGENKASELNKGCSPICAGLGVNIGFFSVGTSCCQSFLCNFSAADGGPRVSTPVLCLGVLFSLWQALLRLYP